LIKPLVATAMALAALFGQLLPGCEEQGRVVVGWVEAKYIEADFGRQYIIVVDRRPFEVHRTFWEDVRVGDRVRFDGRRWEIVRRAGEPSRLVPIEILPTPTPTPTPRPTPTP
jgi:hypothetical protein